MTTNTTPPTAMSATSSELELTRFPGHLILGLSQGKEARDGSFQQVSGGVPS